jgi:outer membrane murein-binding lipoprotein Lpp
MKQWRTKLGAMVVIMMLSVALLMSGCEGSETRNQVNDTVEELAGKKKVDQMKAMKEEIGNIQKEQDDRLKQLEDAD